MVKVGRFFSQFPKRTLSIPTAKNHPQEIWDASSCSYDHLLRCHPTNCCVKQVHARIIIEGSSTKSFFATHLVKSYAKARNFGPAVRVFELVPRKSAFLFNAMIRACSLNEEWVEIAELYGEMKGEGVKPDHYTLPFVIKSFSILRLVEEGESAHVVVIRTGLISNLHVGTALIEMYVEFGDMGNGRKVFDEMPVRDVVAWTSIIYGHVRCGNGAEALQVFRDMRLGNVQPNWVTILSLIPACDRSIHALVVKSGLEIYAEVETPILNMYARNGDVQSAHSLFVRMSDKTLVSWGTMLSGFSQNGFPHEALTAFYQMLKTTNYRPDALIIASVLQACAQQGSLACGEMIHGYLIRAGAITELLVESGLINVYARCGGLSSAERVFHEIGDKNMIVWSAMIAGYGYHGFGEKALRFFDQMKREGFVPDEMAFVSILSACSHSGLVAEGKECFDLMTTKYEMVPNAKHYCCMVDLLGRAGLIEEARDFIEAMPVKANADTWGALLSACRIKGDVEIGELACRKLFELGRGNGDYHVILANLYASCGKWDEKLKIRSMMENEKIRMKVPGCSHISMQFMPRMQSL